MLFFHGLIIGKSFLYVKQFLAIKYKVQEGNLYQIMKILNLVDEINRIDKQGSSIVKIG